MATRLMVLLAFCHLICAPNAFTQTAGKPPSASPSLPSLPPPPPPPPPAEPNGQDAPPPPPAPPPVAANTKHYEFPLGSVWAQGLYQDFQLPAGQVTIKWFAVGPDQSDVSNGIEVTVASPALFTHTSPGGASEMFIGPGAGNVRILARRTSYPGPIAVKISLDLVPAQ